MPTLHIINKASLEHSANVDCLRVLAEDDALILIEDATYLTQKKHIARKSIDIFALQHDLHTRGLSPLPGHTRIINSAEFVELCTRYEKIISWF